MLLLGKGENLSVINNKEFRSVIEDLSSALFIENVAAVLSVNFPNRLIVYGEQIIFDGKDIVDDIVFILIHFLPLRLVQPINAIAAQRKYDTVLRACNLFNFSGERGQGHKALLLSVPMLDFHHRVSCHRLEDLPVIPRKEGATLVIDSCQVSGFQCCKIPDGGFGKKKDLFFVGNDIDNISGNGILLSTIS